MKKYSFDRIQNILAQDFNATLIPSAEDDGRQILYDVVHRRDLTCIRSHVTLDGMRILLSALDYEL